MRNFFAEEPGVVQSDYRNFLDNDLAQQKAIPIVEEDIPPIVQQQVQEEPQTRNFFDEEAQEEPKQRNFFEDEPDEQKPDKKDISYLDRFLAGTEKGVSGELVKALTGNLEDSEILKLAEDDPNFWEGVIMFGGEMVSDAPYLAAGATVGSTIGGLSGGAAGSVVPGLGTTLGGSVGSLLGGGAGALAFNTFMKESLKEYRDFALQGNDLTFGEFIDRANNVASDTFNSGLTGAILSMVQIGAPLLGKSKIFGNLFKTKIGAKSLELASEATALTAIPAIAEGRLPNANDLKGALTVMTPFQLVKAIPAMKNAAKGFKDEANYKKTIEVYDEIAKLLPEELTQERIDDINIEVDKKILKQKSASAKDLLEEKATKEAKTSIEIDKERDTKVKAAEEEVYKILKEEPKIEEKATKQVKEATDRLNREIDFSEKKQSEERKKTNVKIEENLNREVEKAEKTTKKLEKEAESKLSKIEESAELQKKKIRDIETAKLKQKEKLIDSQEKSKLKLEEVKRNQEKKASDKRLENTTAPKAREKQESIRKNQEKRYLEKVAKIEEEAKNNRDAERKANEKRLKSREEKIDDQVSSNMEKEKLASEKQSKQINDRAIENSDKMRSQELARLKRESTARENDIINKAMQRDKKLAKEKQKTFDEYKANLQKAKDKINKAYDLANVQKAREGSKLKSQIVRKWAKENARIEATRPSIKARISKRGTVEDQVSIGEKQKVVKEEKQSFRTKVIDEFYPVKKLVDDISTSELPISQNPYKLARLFKGWSGKVETFLMHKTFDPKTLKFKNKGLSEILKPIRLELKEFSKYLSAKRAVELDSFDKESGIIQKDAKRVIEEGDKKFTKAKKELEVYQKDILDYPEKTGLISPSTRDIFEEMYKDYVPFKREVATKDYQLSGKLRPKKEFFKQTGSSKRVIDPLESIIDNTYRIIRSGEKNVVSKSLVDLMENDKGLGKTIELNPEVPEAQTVKNLVDFMEISEFEKGKITYFDNGVKRSYEVPNNVAEALQGLNKEQFGFMTKALSYPARIVRTTAVALNPKFLVKAVFRDQIEAMIYSKNGFVPGFDLVKGMFHALKRDDLYYKWKAAGGDQSFANSVSRDINQKTLRNVSKTKSKNVITNLEDVGHFLEEIKDTLEKGTRLGDFKKGLSRRGMTPDILREVALGSRDVVIDFNVKGAGLGAAARVTPFINAHIQGLDKFYREMRSNPGKSGKLISGAAMKAVSRLTLPSLALWYINKDDPRYNELPEYEKNKSWHIFLPDWMPKSIQHWKIPKPYELGAYFSSMPERIAEYIYKNDPEEIEQGLRNIAESMMIPTTPSFASPVIETFANKNVFTGAPIIPLSQQGLPPEMQQTAYTTQTAKLIGKNIAKIPYIGETKFASPIEIDHWLTAWTGDIGRAILSISDKSLAAVGIVPEVIDPEKELADYPILNALIGKETSGTQSKSIRKFYEISEDINKYYKGQSEKQKRGEDRDYVRKYQKSEHNRSKRIRKVFSKNFKAINNIRMDNTMTPSEKKIQIDQIASDMTGVAKSFVTDFKKTNR